MPCFNIPTQHPDARTRCRNVAKTHTETVTLEELIDEYRRHECETDETATFASMPSLDYAIERAGMAENDNGKRYSHQYRLKRVNMAKATEKLRGRTAELATCESFDALHGLLCGITNGISGLGPLYAYDTARRLGAKLRIEPQRVYLHAGTRKGAKALGLDYRQASLPMTDFPASLRVLPPDMLESFLCIYKDKLARFAVR